MPNGRNKAIMQKEPVEKQGKWISVAGAGRIS